MRYLVTQSGARRSYAVPALLEQAGMLERFYTDLAGNVGLGRWLAAMRTMPGLPGSLRRLAARRIPSEIVEKTTTFAVPKLMELLGGRFGAGDPASEFLRHLEQDDRFGRAMIRAGFGQATHVYSMLGEARPFLIEARRRGLIAVAEVYILLSTERVMAEERRQFPDWEPRAPDYEALRRRSGQEEGLHQCADHFICPSAAVQADLVEQWGVARSRTTLVPYGMNPAWLELQSKPRHRRVLFVGTAELRKGIHYLAMAAEKLSAAGCQCEFRIAGNVTDQVRQQPLCRHLNFLGRIPRDRIHEEFSAADVFVLPSLAEGSAEVTYEALAAGLPLITTAAAGSVARDGIEGRIIPERDPGALAEAIQQIVEDRPLRDRMAAAARFLARDYTWERYGGRLVTALRNLPSAASS